jgi:hypothetical protein
MWGKKTEKYVNYFIFLNASILIIVKCVIKRRFSFVKLSKINIREHRRSNQKGQSRETGNIGYARRKWCVFSIVCFTRILLAVLCTCSVGVYIVRM